MFGGGGGVWGVLLCMDGSHDTGRKPRFIFVLSYRRVPHRLHNYVTSFLLRKEIMALLKN